MCICTASSLGLLGCSGSRGWMAYLVCSRPWRLAACLAREVVCLTLAIWIAVCECFGRCGGILVWQRSRRTSATLALGNTPLWAAVVCATGGIPAICCDDCASTCFAVVRARISLSCDAGVQGATGLAGLTGQQPATDCLCCRLLLLVSGLTSSPMHGGLCGQTKHGVRPLHTCLCGGNSAGMRPGEARWVGSVEGLLRHCHRNI